MNLLFSGCLILCVISYANADLKKMPYEQRKLILRVQALLSKWLNADQLAELFVHVSDELYEGKDADTIMTNLKDKVMSMHNQEQKAQLEDIVKGVDNAGIPVKSDEVGKTVHAVLSNNFRAMGDFAVNCHENGLKKGSTARKIYYLLGQFLTRNRATSIICRIAARFHKDHWTVIQGHIGDTFLFHGQDCDRDLSDDI